MVNTEIRVVLLNSYLPLLKILQWLPILLIANTRVPIAISSSLFLLFLQHTKLLYQTFVLIAHPN